MLYIKVESKMSYSNNQSLNIDGGIAKNNAILIEVSEPQSHGVGSKRYTDYLVKTKVIMFKIIPNAICNKALK